jgi:hypothetical protein
MRTVRCATPECPSRGLVRTVPDRRAGPGVVYRPDLFCADCDAPLGEGSPHATVEKAVKRPPERRRTTTKKANTKEQR